MAKNENSSTNLHTFVILAYKESPFLESCIRSVKNQTSPSQILIATTTPNSFIKNLAKKYQLEVVAGTHTNIGGDFDFAIHAASTPLVTIAHQDDIYDQTFSEEVVRYFKKYPHSSIIFTDYYEIRKDQKVKTNTLLKIKRTLLFPLRIKTSSKSRFTKRNVLRFGSSICCPAVTFVTKNCPTRIFSSDFQCNVDWHAWEKLSKNHYAFTFIPKLLMGHRISETSTTTNIINQGIRTKEDYEIFKRFWPSFIAKALTNFYKKSEKSNNL